MASEHKIKISADVREISSAFSKIKKLVDDTFKPRKVPITTQTSPGSSSGGFPGVRENSVPHQQFDLFGPRAQPRGPQQLGLPFPGVRPHIPNVGGSVFNGGVSGTMRGLAGGFLRGGAIGAATTVAGMAMNPFAAFNHASDTLNLMSLGFRGGGNQLRSLERGGLQTGFGPESTRQQAIMMQRLLGNTSTLPDAQMFSRQSGFQVEEIAGMMGGFRQAGVRPKESMKMIRDMFTEAVATGFDETAARDALQVISENTSELASSGGASPKAIADVVKSLMASSSFFSTNARAAGVAFQSVDQAFTSGSGPTQALAFRALAKLNPGMSPIQLSEKVGFGLGGSRGAGVGGFKEFLGQLGGLATNKKVGSGTQLTDEQKSMFSIVTRDVLGIKGTLAREIVDAFLAGEDKSLQTKIEKAQENIAEKTYAILDSPQMGMAKLASTTEMISSVLSQEIAGKILPRIGDGIESLYQLLAPFFERFGGVMEASTPVGFLRMMKNGFDPKDPATYNPWIAARRGMQKHIESNRFVPTQPADFGGMNGINGLPFGRISSGFGDRIHPISGQKKFHAGVDIANPAGTPIPAPPGGGTIVYSGWKGGFGNTVQIQNGEYITQMAHAQDLKVKVGDKVKSGQTVGTVGSSGNSTGPHIDYRVFNKEGEAIDPMGKEASDFRAAQSLKDLITEVKKMTGSFPKVPGFVAGQSHKIQKPN